MKKNIQILLLLLLIACTNSDFKNKKLITKELNSAVKQLINIEFKNIAFVQSETLPIFRKNKYSSK